MKQFLLFIIILLVAGCSSVAPWQREILARPQMAVQPLPLAAARTQHVQGSREAGGAAAAAGGGGCGCY